MPGISSGYLAYLSAESDSPEAVLRSAALTCGTLNATYHPSFNGSSAEISAFLNVRGIGVYPWTIDNPFELQSWYGDGCRGITTNHCDFSKGCLTSVRAACGSEATLSLRSRDAVELEMLCSYRGEETRTEVPGILRIGGDDLGLMQSGSRFYASKAGTMTVLFYRDFAVEDSYMNYRVYSAPATLRAE